MSWDDPEAKPLEDINRFATQERAKAIESTGYKFRLLSDGGSDGCVSWVFYSNAPGSIHCEVCDYFITTLPGRGVDKVQNAFCEHMRAVNIP